MIILAFLSYLSVVVSGGLLVWYLWLRGRGSLTYWIRIVPQEATKILGRSLPLTAGKDLIRTTLEEVNGEVRSLNQSANVAVREWDTEGEDRLFVGVILREEVTDALPDGVEIHNLPAQKVVRVSGTNLRGETTQDEAIHAWLAKRDLSARLGIKSRLRGQSFELYQWPLAEGEKAAEASRLTLLNERIFQMRDNLILPILGTFFSLALLATQQPVLFAVGILFIVFLSGACKFVFLHQRSDEADERHLQNY